MPITLGMLTGSKFPYISGGDAGSKWLGTTNPSLALGVPSGVDCLVMVGGNSNSGTDREITAVDWNGVSLTAALTVTQTASRPHLSIWYLLNPTANASGLLNITTSSDRFIGASVYFLKNCTGYDVTGFANTGTSSAVTATGTSTVNGVMIAGAMIVSPNSNIPTTTFTGDVTTETYSQSAAPNSFGRLLSSGYSLGLSPGSRTVTSTPTSSTAQTCGFVIFK